MAVHLLGIRHHGPGSCRNTLQELNRLKPDLILMEAPSDLADLLSHVKDRDLKPPVAMLAYEKDRPDHAAFYPFAGFSPEWQTMRYAVSHDTECRFFDLPLTLSLPLTYAEDEEEAGADAKKEATDAQDTTDAKDAKDAKDDSDADGAAQAEQADADDAAASSLKNRDVFEILAEAAGVEDGEAWWEQTVEQNMRSDGVFEGVLQAVSAVREAHPELASERDLLREAHMRKMLRAAVKEGHERIAVVCGAFHVPALDLSKKQPAVKDDNALLKGLKKCKVECTWIRWTYDRPSMESGYGAGINSPGWYDHLYRAGNDDGTLWCTKIASLLRKEGHDISVAHVMETVRLAQTVAALSERARPNLKDYSDAVTSVMGFGDPVLMALIRKKLIISNRMGSVPDAVPKVPLVADFERLCKKLRLKFTEDSKDLVLDLRKELDLQRSVLLHRLKILAIDLAKPTYISGKGTFKEAWKLKYTPESNLQIIDKAVYGNTVHAAVHNYMMELVRTSDSVRTIAQHLGDVMVADLGDVVDVICDRIDTLSAAGADILDLIRIIDPLSTALRYGSVRDIDLSNVRDILRSALERTDAGGSQICCGIDDETAQETSQIMKSADQALRTLNDDELTSIWESFIRKSASVQAVHPLLTGYFSRLMYDRGMIDAAGLQQLLIFRASGGFDRMQSAQFFAGMLQGTGQLLLIDDALWRIFNAFIQAVPFEDFKALLPLLRRSMSEFTSVEREKLGAKARAYVSGNENPLTGSSGEYDVRFDDPAVQSALPLILRLLGCTQQGA